jgi:DNA-binding beta-propeller fold protein YncE
MRVSLSSLILVLALFLAPVSATAWDDFLVLTTDYETYGGATVVECANPWTADIDVATLTSDAVGRWHEGLYYVVNRGAANIQIIDPTQGYATLRQFSVGVGRNPQDIAFAPDGTAYVSCYDEAVLLQIDTEAGVVLDTWSTAPFADADGLPETAWMQSVGGLLYITCQRLDRNTWWNPAGGSRLLVFDMIAGDWYDTDPGTPEIDGVLLTGQNPSARMQVSSDGSELLVATTGHWVTQDGGFEGVDLVTLQSSGFRVTDQEAGGDIIAFAVVDEDHGWCIVSDSGFDTQFMTFDPGGGTATLIVPSSAYVFADLSWDGGDQIYLCDRTEGAAGLRVFDAWTSVELTASPIAVGRPPFMCVLPEPSGATSVETPAPLALRAPWPNPANPRTSFAFTAAAGERVRVEVCDLRGRRLRTTHVDTGADGAGLFVFDGLDDRGRPLASGAYRALITGTGGGASRGFALVR